MNTGMFGFLTSREATWGLPIITNGGTRPSVRLITLSSRAAGTYDWDLRLKD